MAPTRPHYYSVREIAKANEKAGYHWFNAATTGFFGSKYYDTVYAGRYFITAERMGMDHSHPQVYVLRYVEPDANIETLELLVPNGGISDNWYRTKKQAEKALIIYLATIPNEPPTDRLVATIDTLSALLLQPPDVRADHIVHYAWNVAHAWKEYRTLSGTPPTP